MKTKGIARLIALGLVIILTTFVIGCGGGGGSASDSGTTKVTVSIGQSKLASFVNSLFGKHSSAIPSNVATVTVTISGPGIDPHDPQFQQSRNIEAGQTEISMTFSEVPNGIDRHFLAVATDSSGKSVFQGDVRKALNGGDSGNISIEMGFDISGDWTLTATKQDSSQATTFITFGQIGNALTLSGSVSPGPDLTGVGNTTGNDIHFTATGTDCGHPLSASFDGTVFDGKTASGTFHSTGGCGNDSGSWTMVVGHVTQQFDVTGAWSLFHTELTPQAGSKEGPDFLNMTQTGSAVTFTTVKDSGRAILGTGNVSGNNILLSFDDKDDCNNPSTVNLTGTISADGNSVAGSFTVKGTTGSCANGSSGTWSATKAQPTSLNISGSWAGTLSSGGFGCVTFAQTGTGFLTFSGDVTGSGVLSGNNILMQFSTPSTSTGGTGCKIDFHLSGTTDGSTASGAFTTTNDCGAQDTPGTWSANKGACTPVTPPPTQGTGTISGTVTNATKNEPLSGVTVTAQSGSAIATATTASDGTYSIINVPPGIYSVTFAAADFITITVNNINVDSTATTTLDQPLRANLLAGQVSIVLTWDYSKGNLDLDSHLKGPRAAGDTTQPVLFHVQPPTLGDDSYAFGGTTFVHLDHDWITPADGPPGSSPEETTTINVEVAGTYTFYVHAFSANSSSSSPPAPAPTDLPNSSAKVTVYVGSNSPVIFNVPTGQTGTVWTVFELNGSTNALKEINTLSSDETVIQSASKRVSSVKKKAKRR